MLSKARRIAARTGRSSWMTSQRVTPMPLRRVPSWFSAGSRTAAMCWRVETSMGCCTSPPSLWRSSRSDARSCTGTTTCAAPWPCGQRCGMRGAADGVLLQRGHLRRAGCQPDHRRDPRGSDQPYGQACRGLHARRNVPGLRPGSCEPADTQKQRTHQHAGPTRDLRSIGADGQETGKIQLFFHRFPPWLTPVVTRILLARVESDYRLPGPASVLHIGLRVSRPFAVPITEPATDAFGDVSAGGHGLISVAQRDRLAVIVNDHQRRWGRCAGRSSIGTAGHWD